MVPVTLILTLNSPPNGYFREPCSFVRLRRAVTFSFTPFTVPEVGLEVTGVFSRGVRGPVCDVIDR